MAIQGKLKPPMTPKAHTALYADCDTEIKRLGVARSTLGPGVLYIRKNTLPDLAPEYRVRLKSDKQADGPFFESIRGYFDSAPEAVKASRAKWGIILDIDKGKPDG